MEITFNSSEPKPNVQKYYYCHITDEPKLNLHITALIPTLSRKFTFVSKNNRVKPNFQKTYYCHITGEPKPNLHITASILNKLYQQSLLLFLKQSYSDNLNLT